MARRLKVVVAHHEKVIADTLCMVLNQSNVDATAAYSGVSGVELVLASQPDVAILCIVPAHYDDLNGVYAAVAVRELVPSCRVMLSPGGSGDWVINPLTFAQERGYEFELISEPVHPDELLRIVGESTGGDIEPIRSTPGRRGPECAKTAMPLYDPDAYHREVSNPKPALKRFLSKLIGSE